MSIEQRTFNQIVKLMPGDLMELVDIIGNAAQLSTPLAVSPHNKVLTACVMISHANAMLEQCGCKVEVTISNPTWTDTATYKTEMDDVEEVP